MADDAATLASPVPEAARAILGGDPLTGAFTARRSSHWFAGRPTPVEHPATAWEALMAMPRSGKTVAYIHVPFCANHCLFCGFYRNPTRDPFSGPYSRALIQELEASADHPAVRSGPVHAVYFGGGTPTALDEADLHRVIAAVRANLPLAPDCEITVEGRVHGFDDARIAACLEAGANRFSIGIQTFDTALRHRLGRKADRAGAEGMLAALRARDQAAVVCDLIYGLPNQTLEMWRRDLRLVVDLGLDGVDLYALTLNPSSPLARSIEKGALPPAADLPAQARFYAAGLETLDAAGWHHLTQAHWARTTRERNLYNQLVKEQATCLAYGAGAGGLLAGHRYVLDSDEAAYRQRVAAGEKPLSMMFAPMPDLSARGAVAASLETGRVSAEHLEARVGPGFADRLAPVLAHWAQAGLLAPMPGGYALTPAGWFWQANLIAGLHAVMSQHRDGQGAPLPPQQETPSHARRPHPG
ncbi:heme anaerobic degradation radical SAM methyltransferase ChuW/HutW [Roseospira marina]|uniref:Heme anaerobic degradation radical SAM methyltransferase ChuW/HutW n=1 Tax=Roseospira marina TaxID=140057 RepID=A0A5M6IDW1_9PROT|nr:heme anaerobic degradation radical SAM methyltransferase ChuW/HutW [Roseospira marina]KAA5606433.1 heme anaerobic degradation radical SAM methyltransferase ChuW/HutW [Roseospira marina]MBB4314153.1 oxygen-independent coproporphyrinogen-3 oxidase [Roseospira marina]MBB5087314.1 oxygen-independent coproporphyrinogen-3 oxidase [Roseospira marina]